jgi:hypothetical protein
MAGRYIGSYLGPNGWPTTLAPQHLRSPEQVCAGQTSDGARESLFGTNYHYATVRAYSTNEWSVCGSSTVTGGHAGNCNTVAH